MGGDFDLAWEVLKPLIIGGVSVGVFLAVVFGAIKIGWKYAPWIVVGALLIWFFG
jgi:hypothetical protein